MLGGQCGLTPDQVLDMNIPMVQAIIEGYEEYLFDQRCLAVHYGYWAGYYQSKNPKLPDKVINDMVSKHTMDRRQRMMQLQNVPRPDVDVDLFMQREARLQEYLKARARK